MVEYVTSFVHELNFYVKEMRHKGTLTHRGTLYHLLLELYTVASAQLVSTHH